MRHGDEVVLAAHAAHHPPVGEAVGDRCPEERHHHADVDEARVVALTPRGRLLAEEVVDVRYRGHQDLVALFRRQVVQRPVERGGPEEETALHDRAAVAIRAAAHHARLEERHEAPGEHLARGEEAFVEAPETALALDKVAVPFESQRARRFAELRAGLVALPQPVRDRISERADAELQRAAVLHQRGGVDADGVVGGIDGRVRHAEERMLVRGRVDDHVEEGLVHLGVARHERQLAIHERRDDARRALRTHRGGHVDGKVRIAAQAVSPVAFGDHYQHGVHATRQHVARGVGVVAADVVALRRGNVEHRAWAEVELEELDVVRQADAAQVAQVVELGHACEDATHERIEEAALEVARGARNLERECGED